MVVEINQNLNRNCDNPAKNLIILLFCRYFSQNLWDRVLNKNTQVYNVVKGEDEKIILHKF